MKKEQNTITPSGFVSLETINFNQYNEFYKNRKFKELDITSTPLEEELNAMIKFCNRLNNLVSYNYTFINNKGFWGAIKMEDGIHNVSMFPKTKTKISTINKRIEILSIEIKVLQNLRMKKIIK